MTTGLSWRRPRVLLLGLSAVVGLAAFAMATVSQNGAVTNAPTITGPAGEPGPPFIQRHRLTADALVAVMFAAAVGQNSVQLLLDGDLPVVWDVLLVASVTVAHLALAVRRRWPSAVFAVIATSMLLLAVAPSLHGATAVAMGASAPPLLVPSTLAFSVALYTLAAHTPMRRALGGLAISTVGSAIALARLWAKDTWTSGAPGGPAWRLFLVLALLAVGVLPWVVGRWRAIQRAYLDALRSRADEAERRRLAERESLVDTERRRIAREMHDVLAHSLAVVVGQADGGRLIARHDPARAEEALTTIASVGREALAEVRTLLGSVADVDPGRVPQPTLADLPDLVERVRRSGTPVNLTLTTLASRLPATVELTAFRIVQESLTNVAKHSGPEATAAVTIIEDASALRVEVTDNGGHSKAHRLAVAATEESHGGAHVGRGLTGMAERVRLLGGTLTTGRPREGGFVVSASLPIDRRETDE